MTVEKARRALDRMSNAWRAAAQPAPTPAELQPANEEATAAEKAAQPNKAGKGGA